MRFDSTAIIVGIAFDSQVLFLDASAAIANDRPAFDQVSSRTESTLVTNP